MLEMEVTGLDEISKSLDELANKIEQNETLNVKLNDLFTEEFISTQTKFASFDEFMKNIEIEIHSLDDFDKIPNEFFKENTDFESWDAMLNAATVEFYSKRLFG